LQKHKELVESNSIGPGNDLISLFVLVEIIWVSLAVTIIYS
jgi:hypothetical protein